MFIKLSNNKGALEAGIRKLRKACFKEEIIMEARGRVAYETKSKRKKRKSKESMVLTIKNRKRAFIGY
jgi:ribosomal protein S21